MLPGIAFQSGKERSACHWLLWCPMDSDGLHGGRPESRPLPFKHYHFRGFILHTNLNLIRQKEGNTFQVLTPTNRPKIGHILGGGAVRSFDRAKKWLYLYPEAESRLWTRFVNRSFISFLQSRTIKPSWAYAAFASQASRKLLSSLRDIVAGASGLLWKPPICGEACCPKSKRNEWITPA